MLRKVKDFLYEKESYAIRGACFDVWKELKGMHKESVIDRALTVALRARGFTVESQKRIVVRFQGKDVGSYIPDKIVNGIILLELKVKPTIITADFEQFWNYLRGSEYKLGFLINFSPIGLDIKRCVYDSVRNKKVL
jgi:GxxExxY protein